MSSTDAALPSVALGCCVRDVVPAEALPGLRGSSCCSAVTPSAFQGDCLCFALVCVRLYRVSVGCAALRASKESSARGLRRLCACRPSRSCRRPAVEPVAAAPLV